MTLRANNHVDMDVFCQILELDDGDDNCNFSKALVADFMTQALFLNSNLL